MARQRLDLQQHLFGGRRVTAQHKKVVQRPNVVAAKKVAPDFVDLQFQNVSGLRDLGFSGGLAGLASSRGFGRYERDMIAW